jgi:indolepyruvate ferredoxin oxidoreductase beta subunit
MTKNILLVGVGGQGTILASKLLTLGLMQEGYNVKMSEIHGMSQRGGSVVTHIRYAKEDVYSPVIEPGTADIVVAFEKMEGLRYLDYVSKTGTYVVNNYEIPPMPVTSGAAEYPQGILEEIKNNAQLITADADKIAFELGSPKVMNIVLLGVIIGKMGLAGINWEEIIRNNVKANFADINIAALHRGIELAK